MQASKQPDQCKGFHPHNSASGKAVSHSQHQSQLWDKNHLINTNTSRFQKGKMDPPKKTSENKTAFLQSQSAQSKKKTGILGVFFVSSCSSLGFFYLLPPTVSPGMSYLRIIWLGYQGAQFFYTVINIKSSSSFNFRKNSTNVTSNIHT